MARVMRTLRVLVHGAGRMDLEISHACARIFVYMYTEDTNVCICMCICACISIHICACI